MKWRALNRIEAFAGNWLRVAEVVWSINIRCQTTLILVVLVFGWGPMWNVEVTPWLGAERLSVPGGRAEQGFEDTGSRKRAWGACCSWSWPRSQWRCSKDLVYSDLESSGCISFLIDECSHWSFWRRESMPFWGGAGLLASHLHPYLNETGAVGYPNQRLLPVRGQYCIMTTWRCDELRASFACSVKELARWTYLSDVAFRWSNWRVLNCNESDTYLLPRHVWVVSCGL